jgi:hypothetical protein
VTPPRDGQAWIPTWAMGTACWSPVAVLPWLTGQQVAPPSPTTLPPPANCRRRRWQVACGPWTTASSVAVVPHPACLRRSGRTDRRPEASTLRLVSSAELPGVYRFQVQGRTHRPGPPGARGRGSRMTGLLGTGPRATPLRVAPGEARGHGVCSPAAQADRGSAGPWSRNGRLAMPFLRLVASRDSSPEPRRCRCAGAVHRPRALSRRSPRVLAQTMRTEGQPWGPPYRRRGPGKAQPFARRRESRSRCSQVGAETSATPGLTEALTSAHCLQATAFS